jgi:hypothetical protein
MWGFNENMAGWWYTYPSENMKVIWDDYSQYMEKSNSFSKPPTRWRYTVYSGIHS